MKAIVTVIGKDQVGITAAVCSLLAQHSINILDISQTILQEYFTMVMLVDTAPATSPLWRSLSCWSRPVKSGAVHPHPAEDIFNAMHRI